jgi:molecular chaperone DnaJ
VAVQADWLEKDLYKVLGVAEDADEKTITRAYRALARELHPDTHPDDPGAAERFKEITAAYNVLGDGTKRAEYDDFRKAVNGAGSTGRGSSRWGRGGRGGPQGRNGRTWTRFRVGDTEAASSSDFDGSSWTFEGEDLDDLFGDLFGRARRDARTTDQGEDLEAVLQLDFEGAARGGTSEVTLSGPGGERRFKVRIPGGVDDGQRLRLPGQGGPGSIGGPAGDLYVTVRVAPHPVFGRRGKDLTVEAPVGWPEAVLGGELEVPTLDGPSVRVRVPAGTPEGRTLRVRGHGLRTSGGTGDLLVSVHLTVPDRITDEQREAVEAVARAFRAA